jgi:putative salt-induced outer membrane protein YdiY
MPVPTVQRIPRTARFGFSILFSLLLVATPAHAIVNIESMRVSVDEGFSGDMELNGSLLSGNTRQSRLALGTRLNWKRDATLDFLVLRYDIGESAGVRDINKAFLHGRHVVTLSPRWAWEAFAQVEQNEFRRLARRGLLGGGARRTLFRDADRTAVYLGMGGFTSTETLSDDGTENLARANMYFVVKHALSDTARISSTTYYQPAFNDAGDYRMLESAALAVAITDRLDLTLSLDVSHDSLPPAGVQATDTTLATGISYRF